MAKIAVHDYHDYAYLQRTATEFVNAKQLAQMYDNAGFTHINYQTFDMGAAAVHLARKAYTEN